MKKSTALIWGILILLAAAGLLCYAFMPELAVFTVPLWKWFVAAVLMYWIIRLLFFSNKLANRLSFVFPLALLFLVFEREIGLALGKEDPNFVNNWIIVLAAGLLTAAFHLIFREKPLIKIKNSNTVYGDNGDGTRVYTQSNYGAGAGDAPGANAYAATRSFSMGDNVCYIDALEPFASVSNRMGQLNVYYQNTDMGDPAQQVTLAVNNSLGQTNVHIPRDWRVVLRTEDNFGDVKVRPDTSSTGRVFSVTVNNKGGQVNIVSE